MSNKVQYLPAFREFDESKNQVLSKEEKEKDLRGRLENLGEFMRDANFTWRLDGAINISLIKKEAIRKHKDIDINIDYEYLSKLYKFLQEKDYVVFHEDWNKSTKKRRYLERVSEKEIQDLFDNKKINNLQIAKVDNDGKILSNIDGINFLDLHISKKVGNEYIVDKSGIKIPDKYLKPIDYYITSNGDRIPIAHPVLVVYHKMWMDRDYDNKDISQLKDYLKNEDKEFLYSILEKASNQTIREKTTDLKKIHQNIIEKIRFDMEDSDIKNIISHDPLISQMKEHRRRQVTKEILEAYKKNHDLSFADFFRLAVDFSKAERVDRLKELLKK